MSWITAWIAACWSGVSSKPKLGGEGLVVVRLEAERVAFARGAARVEVEQLGGGVAHLLGGLAPGLVPLAGAELVQRRLVGADAGVAAIRCSCATGTYSVALSAYSRCRNSPASAFVRRGRCRQAQVAADAVVDVHHRVADLQLGQVLDQRVDVADLLLLRCAGARSAPVANSSVSVTNSIACRSRRRARRSPRRAARRAIAKRSSPASNSASEVDARRLDAGCRAAARAGSRAGLRSRRRSARGAASSAMWRLQALQRLGRAAVDAQVGQGARPGAAIVARARAAPAARARRHAAKNCSGFRNSASGGRTGRSRSCCRKR